MTERLNASGGLCAPLGPFYPFFEKADIWPNHIYFLSPIRRFFSFDRDWGFPLKGGPTPRLRDMFPFMTVQRGAITYVTK